MATILTRYGAWVGPSSAPGSAPAGQWHDVVFIHDGASHGRIYLDGALAMERWDMDGRSATSPRTAWRWATGPIPTRATPSTATSTRC